MLRETLLPMPKVAPGKVLAKVRCAGVNSAAIGIGGSYRLCTVDMLTGKATFPAKYQVTDLALPINQK